MDTQEAGRLAQAYGPAVYRLAYARTGNRADAEDVMQETFLRLVRTAPVFRDEEHAKAWLLRVAANCAGDWFRSAWHRHTSPLEEGAGAAVPQPEEGDVLETVLALPTLYRIPVHLFYYEGLSVAEIAQVLGKSEGSVKTRLSRARAMLKKMLTEGGESLV